MSRIEAADRVELERLLLDRDTVQKVVWRARIVLVAAEGLPAGAIAATSGKSQLTVRRWRRRFLAKGVEGLLKDASRPPHRRPLTADKITEVVHMTLHTKPPNASDWSVRSMAAAAGLSCSSIQRMWSAHGLKPHLVKTFKLSRDPNFAAKVRDVVALYLDPPERALVLSLDEKRQIQALDRTQPGLPMKKGRAGTWIHDYKRHGVATLFAALDVVTGKVIGQRMPRHRHQEWLKFLRAIDRATPNALDLHLIADNYATHKHPTVKARLAKHPRFHMHFTPTSASGLNQVERFFGLIIDQRIRRGLSKSVVEQESAIMDYPDQHNAQPKPFVWTKSAAENPEKGRPRETTVRVTTLVRDDAN